MGEGELLYNCTDMLFHGVGCGMIGKTNEEIHGIIQDNIGVSAEHIDFLPFEEYTSRNSCTEV